MVTTPNILETVIAQRDKALAQSLNAPTETIRRQWSLAVCMLEECLPDELRLPVNQGVKGVMQMHPPLDGPVRCLITGNPCGTDTVLVGEDCKCGPCRGYDAGVAECEYP